MEPLRVSGECFVLASKGTARSLKLGNYKKVPYYNRSQNITVSVVSVYGLDDRGSISNRDEIVFH
jgi:hypothetical protein